MAKKQMVIETIEKVDAKLLELGTVKVRISKKEASMNSQMQKIRESFDKETQDDRAKADLIEKEIEQFCMINKMKFDKQRTLELTHGSIGFRTSPPKVNQLSKKYSVATTLELLKRLFPKYIRTKAEADKETILADYSAKEINDEQLASVGLRVDQDERFVCEPKWEELKEAA